MNDLLTNRQHLENKRLKGVHADILLDAGAYQTVSPDYCLSMAKKINWTYDLSSAEVQSASVCTNTPVSGSYRGWGGPETCFVMENFMNMAARYYGVDPIELRKKNVLPPWSVTKVLNFNLGSLPFAEVMDKGSALFGCGPAFVDLFIEALADGGVACGLPRKTALRFAAQTVEGAGKTARISGQHPGALKDVVCSPAGSTIQGVRALEKGGFRSAAMEAVIAAYERNLELKKGE